MSLQQQFEEDLVEGRPLYQTLGQSRLPVEIDIEKAHIGVQL